MALVAVVVVVVGCINCIRHGDNYHDEKRAATLIQLLACRCCASSVPTVSGNEQSGVTYNDRQRYDDEE